LGVTDNNSKEQVKDNDVKTLERILKTNMRVASLPSGKAMVLTAFIEYFLENKEMKRARDEFSEIFLFYAKVWL